MSDVATAPPTAAPGAAAEAWVQAFAEGWRAPAGG